MHHVIMSSAPSSCVMLPVRKRRRVSTTRQAPLLHTHSLLKERARERDQAAEDWSSLPILVLVRVFSLLQSTADRRSVALVCRHWAWCRNDPRLWRSTNVHVTSCKLNSPHWKLLQTRRISRLSLGPLPHSSLTPQVMMKIARTLPELEALSLEFRLYKRGNQYDLRTLAELSKLERLSLTGSLVRVVLPTLPVLKELHALDKVQPVFHGSCDQLEVLVVESFQTGQLPLRIFPRLTILGVRKTNLYAGMFDNTSRDREVQVVNLDLTYSKLPRGVRSFFLQFPNLSSLNISFCGFSESELIAIVGHLTKLTVLNVTGNEVSDDVLTAITSPLTKLEIGASSMVTGRGLESLVHSIGPSLTHLSLSYCSQVSHSTLLQVGVWFPCLVTMNLSGWKFSDVLLGRLSRLNCTIIT